jgi:urea transport system substrate-binding protein
MSLVIPGDRPPSITKSDKIIRIGLLVPFHGADAIWGPSCQYSAVLAAAELNQQGGILGRQIELLAADAGGDPAEVVERARDLVVNQGANVLIGVHLSSVRQALEETFAGKVPYVFAPLFEGSGQLPDVFTIGEVPNRQFSGAVSHFLECHPRSRWFLVGNDYVWPRASHRWIKTFVEARGGQIVGDEYVGIGDDTTDVLDQIEKVRPDIVFESLVGCECVPFNREFAARGLPETIIRLSGAIEENTLMAIGESNTENLYCAAGYFSCLDTDENRDFLDRYRKAFGATAPVQGVLSQSCYEAMRFFGALADRARSLDLDDLARAADGLSFNSPRGRTVLRGGVACGPTFLAQAKGTEFEIVRRFEFDKPE